jgi:hypothetical protein
MRPRERLDDASCSLPKVCPVSEHASKSPARESIVPEGRAARFEEARFRRSARSCLEVSTHQGGVLAPRGKRRLREHLVDRRADN